MSLLSHIKFHGNSWIQQTTGLCDFKWDKDKCKEIQLEKRKCYSYLLQSLVTLLLLVHSDTADRKSFKCSHHKEEIVYEAMNMLINMTESFSDVYCILTTHCIPQTCLPFTQK